MSFLNRIFHQRVEKRDFSFLHTDMHSHVLPGLDDGASSVEEALGYCRALVAAGFQKAIFTPHIMMGVYPNQPDQIAQVAERLSDELRWANIALETSFAAEYMVDESLMDRLQKNESLLDMSGGHVLIEMSYAAPSPYLESVVFQLQLQSKKPILAHPERYLYHHHTDYFERLKEMGCALQLNLLSLTDYYGAPVRKKALSLLKQGAYDFLGTDLHHLRHQEAIQALQAHTKTMDILGAYPWRNKWL
jgi:protein-tyrosine phosphatase